jgi:hypothetical protein
MPGAGQAQIEANLFNRTIPRVMMIGQTNEFLYLASIPAVRFHHIMYLKAIALTRTLPCLAEPGKIIVIGRPNRALAEVIPIWHLFQGLLPTTRRLAW